MVGKVFSDEVMVWEPQSAKESRMKVILMEVKARDQGFVRLVASLAQDR